MQKNVFKSLHNCFIIFIFVTLSRALMNIFQKIILILAEFLDLFIYFKVRGAKKQSVTIAWAGTDRRHELGAPSWSPKRLVVANL